MSECTCRRESGFVFGGKDGTLDRDLVWTDPMCPEHGHMYVEPEEQDNDE